MTLPASLTLPDGTRYLPKVAPVFPQLWRHRTDVELGDLRDCVDRLGGCPQVFILKDESFRLTQQWQYYVRAINYKMDPKRVAMIFDWLRAFSNGNAGFNKPGNPLKNYFTNEDLDAPEFPKLDKIRTCARSVMTGLESADDLLVTTLDGNDMPALKPGRVYPTSIDRVSIDDYVYTPRTHPWLFFVANNIQRDGDTVPFSDDGGIYPWSAPRPVTYLPHVCRSSVWYPKSNLIKLRAGDGLPSPYWP